MPCGGRITAMAKTACRVHGGGITAMTKTACRVVVGLQPWKNLACRVVVELQPRPKRHVVWWSNYSDCQNDMSCCGRITAMAKRSYQLYIVMEIVLRTNLIKKCHYNYIYVSKFMFSDARVCGVVSEFI